MRTLVRFEIRLVKISQAYPLPTGLRDSYKAVTNNVQETLRGGVLPLEIMGTLALRDTTTE